ncbi:MAG: hypothetical protein RMY29_000925 [Nostoc sp. CreGUA01]
MEERIQNSEVRIQKSVGLTQTLRTLGVLGTPVASSRQSRPTHWLVLVVAYGKPQSVYDKLSEVSYFCVSPGQNKFWILDFFFNPKSKI